MRETPKVEVPQTPLEHLRYLREEFSDEIPEKIIHSGPYKVRKNWWQGVTADLEAVIEDEDIKDSELLTEVQSFLINHLTDEFNERLTTAQDIEEANVLIDKVLANQ